MCLRRSAALIAASGMALGALSRASDLLPRELRWVGNLGAIWLAVAFIVGARIGRPRAAAVGGASALILAAFVHYGSMRLVRYGDPELLGYPAPQWAAVGGVLGAVFGGVGSLWSDGDKRVRSVAILTTALGAEALYLLMAHEPNARPVALPLELAAFLLLPLVSLRSGSDRLRTYGWAVSLTPLGAAAIAMVVGVARRIY